MKKKLSAVNRLLNFHFAYMKTYTKKTRKVRRITLQLNPN